MGNYSELFFSNHKGPRRPGAVVEPADPDSPYLLSKYHVPILWLALFEPTDIVDRVTEEGEVWPYLVKDRREAAALLSSRQGFLLSHFRSMNPEWLEHFKSLLLQPLNYRYVHMDSSDVGTLGRGDASRWRRDHETMLGMFAVQAAPRPTSFLGRLLQRRPSNPGLDRCLEDFGSAYCGKHGKEPWPYCGGSGTTNPMPWE